MNGTLKEGEIVKRSIGGTLPLTLKVLYYLGEGKWVAVRLNSRGSAYGLPLLIDASGNILRDELGDLKRPKPQFDYAAGTDLDL